MWLSKIHLGQNHPVKYRSLSTLKNFTNFWELGIEICFCSICPGDYDIIWSLRIKLYNIMLGNGKFYGKKNEPSMRDFRWKIFGWISWWRRSLTETWKNWLVMQWSVIRRNVSKCRRWPGISIEVLREKLLRQATLFSINLGIQFKPLTTHILWDLTFSDPCPLIRIRLIGVTGRGHFYLTSLFSAQTSC